MTGTDPESDGGPPIDRTHAFQPKGAGDPPPLPADLPKIPGITLNFEIARGGMGVVYSGRQDFLDRRVAVKLLSLDLAGEKFAQRFRREAKILAGIKHPHIVACHSAGTTDDGQSYLVMEFVDGPSLKAWIREHGALSCAAALRLAKAVGQALAHAHMLGVIHRDVKPENILLESVTSTAIDIAFPFVPKLVDLGLARMTSDTATLGLTSPGSVMGTPTTMSPEQFDDPDSVDFRSDIYGLGCSLYEMLVGSPAFRSTKLSDIVTKKRRAVGPNPCDENPEVPEEVGELVSSMLSANRDKRPSSYKDLDERLEALMKALPVERQKHSHEPRSAMAGGTEATIPSAQFRQPDPAASAKAGPAGGAPGAPAAGPTGPGLLRTAEIDFLQAGLPGAPARTAFREGGAEPAPTVAPAPASSVSEAGRGGKRRLLAVALALLVAGGAAAAYVAASGRKHESEQPPVSPPPAPAPAPPPPNLPPKVEGLLGPDKVGLMKAFTLQAKATDPEGGRLSYSWTGPDEVTFRGDSHTVKAQVTDGLPGETFAIQVSVSDGTNEPITITKDVTLDEAGFPNEVFLLGFKLDSSKWRFDSEEDKQQRWTLLQGQPVVSCRTKGVLRTMRVALSDGAPWGSFWRVEGRLCSRKDDESLVFAETGVRLELGDVGWSLSCKRAGESGEKWSVELLQARLLGGIWQEDPVTPKPERVEWVEREDAEDDPFADVSITRRRDTFVFRFGQKEEGQFREFTAPIGSFAGQPNLAMWVKGGRGEFRDFTRW